MHDCESFERRSPKHVYMHVYIDFYWNIFLPRLFKIRKCTKPANVPVSPVNEDNRGMFL